MSYEQEQILSNKIITILLSWQKHMQNNDVLKNTNIDLKLVMRVHGTISILMGFITFILPHSVYKSSEGNYNHMAHEYVRLYGCLTLTIGYFVYATQDIKDGRLMRSISETFAICYVLQSLTMLRAQFSNPNGHSLFHWLIAVLFLFIGFSYGYIRLIKKIKTYELPSVSDD